jgi:hypothetical protein
MAHLSDGQKHQVLRQLAAGRSYSSVAVAMSREYGIVIDRFQVRTYDPTNPRFAAAEKWREVYWSYRHEYLEQVARAPMFHPAYRLNELQRLLEKARQRENLVLCLKILKQAAIEAGRADRFAGQRVDQFHTQASAMSSEERRALASEIIQSAIERSRVGSTRLELSA